MGAGSVGCFVGGRLQAAGATVHFIGRPRVLQGLREHGLSLSDLEGGQVDLPASRLSLHETPPTEAALVLLCVKSGATADAAAQLAARLPAGTPVLSLQNGVATTEIAARGAPGLLWLPGMVPFNVAELGPGRFHRGTAGTLAAQAHPVLQAWLPLFHAAGLPLVLHADLRPVQWGKLLLNLNNPVNALSGLPLRAELLDRDYRWVFAALQDEALAAMRAAGIAPARLTPLPAARLPALLRLPTWAFRVMASRMLRIDARARSSMADDLALGRPTEVDAFCGAVVRLAQSQGQKAPCNEHMLALLSAPRPGTMSGVELRRALAV
jgi:2-dehydropantoate 2-reductase